MTPQKQLMIAGILGTSLMAFHPVPAAVVKVENSSSGWELRIQMDPQGPWESYFIKGVSYTPTKIGQDPNISNLTDWMLYDFNSNGKNDSAYDSFVDSNLNNKQDANEPTVGDFSLLKDMGVNTIRVYHHASDSPEVVPGYFSAGSRLQYNHPPNIQLLKELYSQYGIRVAMGDFLGAYTIGVGVPFSQGTDYTNQAQKDQIMLSVLRMVEDFKNEDFLLLYILGNENNYDFTSTNAGKFPREYAMFVEEVVKKIKEKDPNHPVVVCQGDLGLINALAQYAPSVDIFGANVYRDLGFGDFFEKVKTIYTKPVLLTEYGDLHPSFINSQINQTRQSNYHSYNWLQIENNGPAGTGQKNALGGFAYSWLDNWWQSGKPKEHDVVLTGNNNEWDGIAGQGSENTSPFLRQLRTVYTTYKSLWTVGKPTLTVAGVGSNFLHVSWSSATYAKNYLLQSETGVDLSVALSSFTLNYQENNLTPNTRYQRAVKAKNGFTTSVSNLVSQHTWAASPINPQVLDVTISSFRVSWSANGNPAGTEYRVKYSSGSGAESTVRVAQTSADISGLSKDTLYTVQIQAINKEGVLTTFTTPVSTRTLSGQQPCPCYDVNGDGHITPIDVLQVINYLNRFGPGPTPPDKVNYDVNRDGNIIPLDVLLIINYLNRFGSSSVVYDPKPVPTEFPNIFYPLRGETVKISYRTDQTGPVTVRLQDQRGDEIRTLYSDAVWGGDQVITWDGRNHAGQLVSSGVYRYLIDTGTTRQSGKILLLK